jgi:drug/metabolite transporter (DMT)-like permease
MSLLIAVPCAIAAAVAYGGSTAVEHTAITETEGTDAKGLLVVVGNPRWLLGMLGDGVGLILQVLALATGPVVLIQPLLVLALPISLPIAWWLGGPKPGLPQYGACAWIIAGLSVFFALIGNPGDGDPLKLRPAGIAAGVVVAVGLVALVAVYRRTGAVKAAVYGTVAGAWFGFVAVLMDATTLAWQHDGIGAFGHLDALVPLVALVVIGAASIALTQAAFQVGALAASFPANLTADPVTAVILGALLLHQDLPLSSVHVAVYLLCLGAVLYGAVRLAADPSVDSVTAD